MESGNILIGVISIVAIVLPFIFMYRKSKSTERGLVKNLKEYAQNNGFQVEMWESVGNMVLGIDELNKLAFFSEIVGEEYEVKHFNLADIAICKVNREVREIKYHGGKDSLTHSLEMCFYPKNRREDIGVFNLYHEDKNKNLNGEIQLADQWVEKFNGLIM